MPHAALFAGAKCPRWGLVLVAALVWCVSASAQAPRAKGWVREPSHIRAAIPLMLRFQDYLPEEVDLSGRFPVPGDQGRQSSCTAWATGYAMRSYYEGQRRHWDFSSPGQIISPAYIYNRLHGFGGDCQAGTPISEALNLLKTDGAPTLSAYPYVENDCARPPGPDLVRTGAEFRISGWAALDNKRPDDAKGQLSRGHPVVFGMDVSERFERLRGQDVYDDILSPRTGGHAMVLVGYSERRQAFKVMNSWGTAWGSGGFGWVSYRAVRHLGDLMFVMEVPSDAPPVPPAPAPVVTPVPAPGPAPAPMPMPVPVPVPVPVPDVPVVTPAPAPEPVVVAPPVPGPPGPVVTPVPLPSMRVLQAQAEARAGALACARIDARVGTDRVVHLQGFAGSAADLARLRSDLSALPGVFGVESQVQLRPWPQCEVYLNFAAELKTPRGLGAQLRGASAQVFVAGDSLSIEVRTPQYPSYLYVTYLQAGGEAVNLYWPQGRLPKALPPGTTVTVGGGSGAEPRYRITAPFGDEMVVVVASASPLFQGELPQTDTSRDYLTTFRKSFLLRPRSGGGARTVSALALPLRTQPRD